MSTNNFISKNNTKVFKYLRYVKYNIQNILFIIGGCLRNFGIISSCYKKIRSLRNSHFGEKCFILATGPSLTLSDVEKLRGEFTFAMNNICLLYDKTDWRPSLYGIQDANVFDRVKHILLAEKSTVLVSSTVAEICQEARSFDQFPLNAHYLRYDYRYTNKLHVKFSTNALWGVYDAYSITFSLMEIAAYMGFTEIYLLGCDCNQKIGVVNHFIECGHIPPSYDLETAAIRNIFAHTKAKEYFETRGIKIYNATRGGMLEVYERVNLDEILSKDRNK